MIRKKVLSAIFASAIFATTIFAEDAKEIIKETGVQGGLVVHLNCGDGKLTADLHVNDSYVIHGLSKSADNILAARSHIKSKNLYGKITVDLFDSEILPYNDNFVDLFVTKDLGKISMDEVNRVLAPEGVAYINGNKTIKPRPDNIDDWTHYLHNPTNNAVADDDLVGPPEKLQWKAKPNWGRSHEFIGSIRGLASSEKRFFAVYDAALRGTTAYMGKNGRPVGLPQEWILTARSAFNGTLLWKIPLNWASVGGGTWSGQVLPRTLVVNNKDDVFITMGAKQKLVCLDAVTGKTKKDYGIDFVYEILHENGKLLIHKKGKYVGKDIHKVPATITMLDAKTGEIIWNKDLTNLMPFSMSMQNNNVVYHDYTNLVMLNANDGTERWAFKDTMKIPRRIFETVVLKDEAVLISKETRKSKFKSISVKDGTLLWEAKENRGRACSANRDIFVTKDNLVWFYKCETGHDILTGEIKKKLGKVSHSAGHHARCYRSKATNKYLFFPYRGVELADLSGEKKHARFDWVRSMCQVGFMPSNGMLHSTPHPCSCYPGVAIKGFNSLRSSVDFPKSKDIRFIKGEAFGKFSKTENKPTDWATYRNDGKRSGNINSDIPTALEKKWESNLKGDLTPATYANGKIYVCNKTNNTVYCLNGNDGKIIWEYTAGGTVDLPPTIYSNTALFGSHDGWVYSLDATTGALAWKFRGALEARLILDDNKIASPWPIHGSILIQDDIAYFAAGRSTFLDGGIYLYGLNPLTGETIHKRHLDRPYPKLRKDKGEGFDMLGSLADVLVSDGEFIYMLQMMFDKELKVVEAPEITHHGDRKMGRHIMATNGFLDDSNHNRISWLYSERWAGFYILNQAPKAGQILSFDDKQTYGIKFFTTRNGNSPLLSVGGKGYLLFADENNNEPGLVDGKNEEAWKPVRWLPEIDISKYQKKFQTKKRGRFFDAYAKNNEKGTGFTRSKMPEWMTWVKIRVRGMVSVNNALFITGTPDIVEEKDPYASFEGKLGSIIQSVSKKDGKQISEIKTESQVVFDGMIGADGKLIVVLKNGKIICY